MKVLPRLADPRKADPKNYILKTNSILKFVFMYLSKVVQRLSLLFVMMALTLSAFAQGQKAFGLVRDEYGDPVIGAFVLIKGTSTGTSTALDGEFSLDVPKTGTVLQVSCIGYLTQEVVWNGRQLIVALQEESQMLEESIAIGYGITQTRGLLTNSISTVSEQAMTTGSYGVIGQSLDGAIPGVYVYQTTAFPGSSPTITIRGGAPISMERETL